jgi:hypothetical protein
MGVAQSAVPKLMGACGILIIAMIRAKFVGFSVISAIEVSGILKMIRSYYGRRLSIWKLRESR